MMNDPYTSNPIAEQALDLHTDTPNTAQTLELLEERAEVVKKSILAGKVVVGKTVNIRTVNVPVELKEEILTIHVVGGDSGVLSGDYDNQELISYIDETSQSAIMLNDKPLALGEQVEIVLSREVATVIKKTHAVEEVSLRTYTETTTHELATELRREELEVNAESYTQTHSTTV